MKTMLKIALAVFLCAQVWLAFQIFNLNKEGSAYAEDLIELSKVKYGIFNVDEWKDKISTIVSEKIDSFELTPENREKVRAELRSFLYRQVERFEANYKSRNKETLGGLMRNAVAGLTQTFDEIKEEVPAITDQVLEFLDDPENKKNLKAFVNKKLSAYTEETFSETDYTVHDAILAKTGTDSREGAIAYLRGKTAEIDQAKELYVYLSGGLYAAVVLILLFLWKEDKWTLTLVIGYALVLLSLGVLLPMIEIDARIDKLSFALMGQRIAFTDQVLFYKNKSILDVVQVLVQNGKIDLVAVAVLIFSFSVLFPLLKLASSIVYLFNEKLRETKFVNFMVFKTGKWSMADVMVVAIFMAYIGFSGIVSEQLGQLQDVSSTVDILTTDHSRLNEGFFLFTGFVVLSIMISAKLDKTDLRRT